LASLPRERKAPKGQNKVCKPKAFSPENREFRAGELSRDKRRNLCKDRGPAGKPGASARALQGHQPASKKVRAASRGKRSGLLQLKPPPAHKDQHNRGKLNQV